MQKNYRSDSSDMDHQSHEPLAGRNQEVKGDKAVEKPSCPEG